MSTTLQQCHSPILICYSYQQLKYSVLVGCSVHDSFLCRSKAYYKETKCLRKPGQFENHPSSLSESPKEPEYHKSWRPFTSEALRLLKQINS